ncbi:MAG: acyl-CoA dehydrogenase family protein [Myxococcota bacterium]
MDFELDHDQRAILDAVAVLLDQHAGASRAIELAPKAEYDHSLEAALREAGFLDVALGDETGSLEAALVAEAVARAGGVVAIAAATLVAPALTGRSLPGPIALARVDESRPDQSEPVRFAGHARTLLVLDGEQARVVTLESGEAEPIPSNYGYPMARVSSDALGRGEALGAGSGARLVRWWRLAIAVEAVGTMGAALETTVEFVRRRRQFGRAIGSFQAVQHRLAECAVLVEGSRWLAYEAAYEGVSEGGAGEDAAREQRAATAAAHATAAAGRVFAETHQLTGAMGFTREHDLHVWSMRLQALRVELDGVSGQRRAVAQARWVQKR